MQQLEKSTVSSKIKIRLTWLPYVLFSGSILVTLVAIFSLSEWVEVSGWHHACQHVMIFGSGLVAGSSLFIINKTKRGKL